MENTCSIVIMLEFDEQTTATIRNLKIAACENQDSCDLLPPHLSIGLYVEASLPQLTEWTKAFAEKHNSFSITFTSIGNFGNRVLFLSPQMNTDLLLFYSDYHEKYDELTSESGKHYALQTGKWVPHCTLFLSEKENIAPSIEAVNKLFIPFSGTVTHISIGQDNPIKTISRFPL